jgi:hypothetical protein
VTVPVLSGDAEINRIQSLPSRPVVDCERESGTRRWKPQAQALIEVVTARHARPRLSCGCRDRHVEVVGRGELLVFHTPPPKQPPTLPLRVPVADFCRDSVHDSSVVERVLQLRQGQKIVLPGLGNHLFCVTELNPVQAWTLWEAPIAGGVTGFISVGGGKSYMGVLMPMAVPQVKKWAIFIKPDQRIHYRDAYLRLREHFYVPAFVLESGSTVASEGEFVPGRPVLHAVPYSLLSSTKSTQLLESIDPDGVIFDESHLLANLRSSRTMRMFRFLANRIEQKRYVFVCDWSGSKVKKTMKDCAYLAKHALGLGSPYPITKTAIEDWAGCIDPIAMRDRSSPTAHALRRAFGDPSFVGEDDEIDQLASAGLIDDGVREGHRDRVVVTPGVISTKTSSITCSITIRKRDPKDKVPVAVQAALKGVRDNSERPDGDALIDAMEVATTARTVGAGYYHYWAFPHATEADKAPCGTIEKWKAARKKWNKEVRRKLLDAEPHLDSYSLLENAAERAWREPRYTGDLPVWPAESWPEWAAIKDRVQYDERTRWIDDYLARDAADWACEHVGVVWCLSPTFGKRVAEIAGINYHGGGQDAEAKIKVEDGKRSIVASIRSHGESRDGLQHKFHRQLVAELPASADRYEQLFGRLGRDGQVEDTIETDIYQHTPEYRDALKQALMYAEFIQQTTPNRQLLLAADFEFRV